MMRSVIVVTNGSAGKILEILKNGQEVKLVKVFSHPETKKKVADLTTHDEGTLGHAIDYDGDIEHRERGIFAKEIAAFLTKVLAAEKINHLVFVAPAKMLGELRQETVHLTRTNNVYELHKDLLPQRLSHEEMVEKIGEDLDIAHW
jgi:protein required for attachment to host cells